MLQPDLSPYYTDDNLDIHRRMEESYRQNITLQQQYWNEADIDTRFFSGDQTLWQQLYGYGYLPLITRRQFQFNRIRRIVNMPTGFQRRNRKSTVVVPVHTKDQQGADDWTGVLDYVNHKADIYNTISDAFQGACVTGFNLLSFWMDYRSDPINGDIRCDNISYNGAMVDCTSKKQDLSDANFIWTRKWMSKKQIISLLPERADEIEAMPYTANRDDKFIFLPENYQYGIRTLLPYDEYWYLDFRDSKTLVDMETGETKEWDGDNKSLKEFLAMYPMVKAVTTQKQTCRLAISVGNRVMYDGPNPYSSDRYPFIGVYGYFEPQIPSFALKMQGIVRGLRDAQFLYNRRKVIELDMLESQINSGWKFKEDALIDPNDVFLQGQGRGLAIRSSASMDDVQQIPPPDIPAGVFQLSQSMSQEIQEISGVNEELLGSATDEKAGILSMLRQGAGLTTLQVLFDQLDMSQKHAGALCMDLVRNNFQPKKIEMILGKKPSEEFYTKLFPEYNCSVEEGSLTMNQKQMQFQQLLSMRELGVNIPESILIDTAPLQNKKELLEAIEAQSKQAQEKEDAQLQQQMQSQEVINQTLMAKAESDQALAKERLNKIGLDAAVNVERLQRAEEERDQATLTKIKAVKELETMDLGHLEQLINLYKSLKEPEVEAQAAPQQSAM